jgi:hypothetical protein
VVTVRASYFGTLLHYTQQRTDVEDTAAVGSDGPETLIVSSTELRILVP